MMKTSQTIKARQYSPISPLQRNGDRWQFRSESREREPYTTIRNRRNYRCNCPTIGLCKHITAAVLADAREKFQIVQVWTDETDAQRQRRRTERFFANGRPFWITYAIRISAADRAWNAARPDAWKTAVVAQGDGWKVWAENDGERWLFWCSRPVGLDGQQWGQVGQSFARASWGFESTREQFDAWWRKVVGTGSR